MGVGSIPWKSATSSAEGPTCYALRHRMFTHTALAFIDCADAGPVTVLAAEIHKTPATVDPNLPPLPNQAATRASGLAQCAFEISMVSRQIESGEKRYDFLPSIQGRFTCTQPLYQ